MKPSSNSKLRSLKKIEVIIDNYGNKRARVQYKDPVTGEDKVANIAYGVNRVKYHIARL